MQKQGWLPEEDRSLQKQSDQHQKFFWHYVLTLFFGHKMPNPPLAETAQWIKAGLQFIKVPFPSMQYISSAIL